MTWTGPGIKVAHGADGTIVHHLQGPTLPGPVWVWHVRDTYLGTAANHDRLAAEFLAKRQEWGAGYAAGKAEQARRDALDLVMWALTWTEEMR